MLSSHIIDHKRHPNDVLMYLYARYVAYLGIFLKPFFTSDFESEMGSGPLLHYCN